MELSIVPHFFPYTFENLGKRALSKTLLLKRQEGYRCEKKKSEMSICFAKAL